MLAVDDTRLAGRRLEMTRTGASPGRPGQVPGGLSTAQRQDRQTLSANVCHSILYGIALTPVVATFLVRPHFFKEKHYS